MKQHPPRQIFEKLVNKNAIKCKTGGPPHAIFPETLDPPLGIWAKTSHTPSPGFSTRVHMFVKITYSISSKTSKSMVKFQNRR
jgi:hypothetical protein